MALKPKRSDRLVRYECPECGAITSDWYTFSTDWAPMCCGQDMRPYHRDVEDVVTGEWVKH